MTGNKNRATAVLMGDIVASERFPLPDDLHSLFNEVVEDHNRMHRDRLLSPLTITLGDEFQGLTRTLTEALPILKGVRMALMRHSVECRFVLGQAEIRTQLNPVAAWNMMGNGLSRARKKLNEKNPHTLYRFALLSDPTSETLLDAIGAGLTTIERGWTRQQRDDSIALLDGQSPATLAQRRNVSVHSIYKVRASANYEAYSLQWQAIEAALVEIDRKSNP